MACAGYRPGPHDDTAARSTSRLHPTQHLATLMQAEGDDPARGITLEPELGTDLVHGEHILRHRRCFECGLAAALDEEPAVAFEDLERELRHQRVVARVGL